jgi:predicted phage-related endonuclease
MLAKNLDSQIHELRELRRMADELAAAIDTIQDAIKAEMTAAGVDVLTGSDWKAVWKPITTSRIDTIALKKALPDLAAQFTKTSTVRRFSVA